MKPRVYAAIAALGMCLFVAILLSARPWAQPDQRVPTCQHRQPVANGKSAKGTPWTVAVSIRRNERKCSSWLLGFEFRPDQKPYRRRWEAALSRKTPMPGSFGWRWGIPAGGHLPNDFTISSRDEYEGSERVFAGAAGGSVKYITLAMSNGRHMVIHPRLPSRALRERFVWLRNLRYFVQYYNLGIHVRKVTVRSSNGVFTIRGNEGAFEKIGLTGL